MKKRIILILALGVSFAPAVFAGGPADGILSASNAKVGQSRVSGTAIHSCQFSDPDKVYTDVAVTKTQKAGTASASDAQTVD